MPAARSTRSSLGPASPVYVIDVPPAAIRRPAFGIECGSSRDSIANGPIGNASPASNSWTSQAPFRALI